MDAFTTVRSIAAPLPIKDVDTDMIIPAQFLTSTSREGFGDNLFLRLRKNDPDFFMNQPRYRSAQILVADSNFGCGSSREHAVWALRGAGIRVVIAPSFADIFTSNSGKNGLLLVRLENEVVRQLLTDVATTTVELSIDLERQMVSSSDGREWSFPCDPFLKFCMMNGLDDMDYLRSRLPQIEELKSRQKRNWFFSIGTPNR
jgi:3-isopropylmalate/(R)-2-methylmalate dehydratase small subunit